MHAPWLAEWDTMFQPRPRLLSDAGIRGEKELKFSSSQRHVFPWQGAPKLPLGGWEKGAAPRNQSEGSEDASKLPPRPVLVGAERSQRPGSIYGARGPVPSPSGRYPAPGGTCRLTCQEATGSPEDLCLSAQICSHRQGLHRAQQGDYFSVQARKGLAVLAAA